MELKMSMGKRIKNLRKKKNWSQAELGEKVGMTFGGISGIEADRRDTSQAIIIKLSEIFGVTTDYILIGKEDGNSISEEEQEIIKTIREDNSIKKALIELINAKKKVINYINSLRG